MLGGISVNLTRLRIRVDGAFTGLNRKFGLPGATGGTPIGCGIGPELALLVPALGRL